jgi:PDZ domain-containing secreted protein
MKKTKRLVEELLLAASKTLRFPPCGQYGPETYEDYVEDNLSEQDKANFEEHKKSCPYCQEQIEQARTRERIASRSFIMSEIGQRRSISEALKHLDEMQAQEKSERKLRRKATLLAASEDYEGKTGTAYGLAVDTESGSGSKMECFAWVGSQKTGEPMLDLRGPEIRSVKKDDTKYAVEPPLDRLEDELEDLFGVNSLLKKLGLNRREITVDIRHAVEDGFIKDAHSLGLAVLVAILNALAGNRDLSNMAFSAGIRKNGRLTCVGDLAQKIAVAGQAGVSELIVSKDHENDVRNLPGDRKTLQVSFFATLREVLEYLKLSECLEDCFESGKQALPPVPIASLGKACSRAVEHVEECLFVIEIAGSKGIDPVLAREICALAEDLCVIRHEFRPISTALVVGDPSKIENILSASAMKLSQGWDIFSSQKNLIKLSSIVDGESMGFVADCSGRIRSIRKLNLDLSGAFPISRLLSGANRRHAILSKLTDSLMFFMSSVGNTVMVFSDGGLVGRYKNGKWLPTDIDGFGQFLQAAGARKSILPEVIEKIGRAALRMSDLNTGGIFVLFRERADMEGRYSNALNGLSVSLAVESIRELTDEELVNFAKEDGAVLIDKAGNIHSFMAFLRPGNAISIDSDPARGARHNVAKIISKEVGCLCIVISQDGVITVYEDGEQGFAL